MNEINEEVRNKRVFKRRKDMETEDNLVGSSFSIKLSSQTNCLSEVSFPSQGQDRSRVEPQKSGKGLSANKMKHFKKSVSGEASRQQSEVSQVPAPQPPMQSKSVSMVVTINKTDQDQKEKSNGKMIELVGLLSIMYAIIIIIFGILLPFVETIKNIWQRSAHTAMFELYIYIVATLFMIYLQITLIDLKCPWFKSKDSDDDSATSSSSTLNNNNNNNNNNSVNNNVDIIEHLTNNSNNYFNCEDSKQDYDKRTALGNNSNNNTNNSNNNNNNNSIENSKLFHSSLSVSDYKDREFSDTYLARKPKYSEVVQPPVTAFLRFNSTTQLASQSISSGMNRAFVQQENARNVEDTGRKSGRYPEPKAKDDLLDEIPKVDEVRYIREEVTEEVFIDLTQLGSIFSHHGSSFFLRIGTLLFGVGHMIFTILELENSFKNKQICVVSTFWWVYLTRFIFVFVQTFVIFKHPAISAKRGNEAVLRFGFMHVIATNLCIWVKTLLSEITLEATYLRKNYTPQYQGNNCTSNSSILHTLAPYLFPFVLEYSLLCISVIAVMYWSLGEHSKNNIQRGLTNLFKIDVFVVDKEKDDSISTNEDDHENDMFGKSHRGIFFGFILIAGVVIVIAFFNFNITDLVRSEYFYLSSDLSLITFLLMAVIAGLVLMNPLSFIKKPSSIDDVLLIIAMFGGVMYHVALLMSSIYALSEVKFKEKGLEIIRILNSIASLLFLVGQVILVTSGLRRYPSRHSQVMEKPGRGVVTFLVIANIGSWIFHSMLSNNHDLQYRPSNLFGKIPWIILLNLSLPLLLFFFFHSSVCLADIWHQAYTPLHSKLHKPTAPAAADDAVATNAQAVDGNRYNDDIVSTASNLAFVSSQQDLKVTHSKSALDMLNPLIRSVSVSQLSQTPVQLPGTRQLESDSLGGSFPHIPDNPYSSLSRQRAYFNRINKLSPLASPAELKSFDDEHNSNYNNNNNNNNNNKDDDDNDDDDDNVGDDDGYQVRM